MQAIRYNVENLSVAPSGDHTEVRMSIDKSHINANLEDFIDNYGARKVLAKYTIMLNTPEIESLRQLMTAWIEQLRKSDSISDVMLASKQYGWVGKGFKYNGIYYGPDKSQTPTFVIDKTLDDMYKSVGDLPKWSACANHILSQHRPAAWCAVASAFAAPLTVFTGTSGSLLSIISRRTGTGKTTALKVALAVWAHPRRAMSSLDDTVNSINKKMGVLNSLPVYWDEVRGRADVQKFTATVFRLSQGKEKERLDANLSQRKSGDWATMLTIASNESLQDHLSHILGGTDAGAARVFELDVDTGLADGMNDAQARHFYRQLESNYGNAGVIYAQYLAAHHDEVEQLVKQVDSAMAEKLKSTSGERFWVATITTLVTGAMIANKLSLCQFNIKKLTTYLIREFRRMRVTLARENPVGGTHAKDMLTRFIHEQKDYTIISSIQARRTRAADNAVVYMDSERQPATIRLARDENTIRLLRQDFKSWVYDQEGAGGSHILRDLNAMGVKEIHGSIDAGTARGMGTRHRCLEFELVGEFAHLNANDGGDDNQNGDLG